MCLYTNLDSWKSFLTFEGSILQQPRGFGYSVIDGLFDRLFRRSGVFKDVIHACYHTARSAELEESIHFSSNNKIIKNERIKEGKKITYCSWITSDFTYPCSFFRTSLSYKTRKKIEQEQRIFNSLLTWMVASLTAALIFAAVSLNMLEDLLLIWTSNIKEVTRRFPGKTLAVGRTGRERIRRQS